MSHKHSACIPPPQDYAPRSSSKPGSQIKDKRGGHNIAGHTSHYNRHQSSTSHERHREVEQNLPPKIQPIDKFHRDIHDDYFAQEDSNEQNDETSEEKSKTTANGSDSEDDPLDAYMKSLVSEQSKRTSSSTPSESSPKQDEHPKGGETARGVRLDIDASEDVEESYYQFVEKKKNQLDECESELDAKQELVEYDRDGNIITVRKVKKDVEPLPCVDHSTIDYCDFEKVFYKEHDEISKMTQEQIANLRSKLEIKVSGNEPPKPVCSFAHFKFDDQLMKVIRRSEYTQPTPIQAQAIPAILSGRNIIGIAMTGSGKTAAYLWPMIVHIMHQSDLELGDGPIGLVLVPTRELAQQVYSEAKKFSHSYKLNIVCAYGGGSKYEQTKDLESGAEIVVATPGRLIDLVKIGATNLKRVTFLVLDEADRFFEMGFEYQVRSICDHIRPDRQTLLFSATFKQKIENLARTVTEDPIKIVQKSLGEANEDVTQRIVILKSVTHKWEWLVKKFEDFVATGSLLIFVTRIVNAEELHRSLVDYGKETLLLHGDMEQSMRNKVITSFKRQENNVMIATDVAARGLDINHIKIVINYDAARDIDTHIHRIGRTGRAGSKGDAYTLLTDKDKDFAGYLVKHLECSNQEVSHDLISLAMQSNQFRKSRSQRPKATSGRSIARSGANSFKHNRSTDGSPPMKKRTPHYAPSMCLSDNYKRTDFSKDGDLESSKSGYSGYR